MTKKDYIIIARVFNTTSQIWRDAITRHRKKGDIEKIRSVNQLLASMDILIKGLCFEMKKDNPLFEENKFIKACGNYY